VNFIIFNPDEMRAESLACYGHPLVKTPNIDRLAAEGVRFDQCHVQHTVCTPSRCSFMTGWYPHVRGHRTLWHALRPEDPSLFQYLHEAGYYIDWYGKNDLYHPENVRRYVDHHGDREPQPGDPEPPAPLAGGGNSFKQGEPGYYSFLFDAFEGDPWAHHDSQKVQGAIQCLRHGDFGDKPFVLYLPIGNPHCPYHAVEPFDSMYDPDDLPPLRPVVTEGKPDYHELIREYRDIPDYPEGTLRRIQAKYLGMISYVDWLLGELLTALEASGHAEDTAIFFFSDHGDWAGDFGLVEKWPSGLDDCLTRIPMIVKAPGCRGGHVVEEPIECFDMMATILELAGVEARHTHFARSLVPQLRGAAGDPERIIFAEGGYDGRMEPHCLEGHGSAGDVKLDPKGIYYPKALQQQERPESVCRATMLRTMTHKLIYRERPGAVCELYDLESDPQELRNVYDDPAYAGVRQQLETEMLRWYQRTSDVTPLDEDPRGMPAKE
jgi:choline-sulfatase